MNTLKPLLIVAIVGGIGYGAWSRLNRKPDNLQGWDSTPTVQLSDPNTNWSPGATPAAPAAGAEAPPTFGGLATAAPDGALPTAPDPGSPATPPVDPSLTASGQPAAAAPPFGNPAPESATGSSTNPVGPGASGADPASAAAGMAGTAGSPAETGAPPAGYPQTGSPAADATGAAVASPFGPVLDRARQELDAGLLAEGLLQLSAWYDNPQLATGEQQQLNELLDQVAGAVVYSNRPYGEPLHEIQPGDRLDDIAARYSVSPQLLAKINGIEDTQNLRPGERIKVLRGPFEASISLGKKMLVLWVGGSYAGRFRVGFGRDWPPREGPYTVENKMVNPVYQGQNRQIEGGDPSNPLGARWIGLAGGYGIHGTNDPNQLDSPELAGCIAMSPRDLEDVYDILTIGSRVTIHP